MPDPITVEIQAQVDDAIRGLGTATSSFTSLQHANQDAAGALGVFGISLTALNNPITAVASGLKDTINTAESWAETIDKLSAASGQNAEKTSTMAVVLGDFGVEAGSLTATIRAMTKEGLQFNLETLEQLAAKYQSIQDPVERDAFVFKTFGRTGLDLNDVLSATPAKLQALAESAQYTGKVINDQAVTSIQNFSIKTRQLDDDLQGLKITIAGPVIDTLSNAITGFHNLTGAVQALGIYTAVHTGAMSQQEAALRIAAAQAGDMWAATDKLTDAQRAAWTAENQVSDAHDRAAAALAAATVPTIAMANNVAILSGRFSDQAKAESDAAAAATVQAAAQVAANQTLAAAQTATANATLANDNLYTSLAKVTTASLAAAAIKDLETAMAAHPENAANYQAAIEKIGVKAGIMTPAGIEAGNALKTLDALLDSGRVSPEQYAAELDKINKAANSGIPVSFAKDLGPAFTALDVHLDTTQKNHLSPMNLALSDNKPAQAAVTNFDTLTKNGLSPANSELDKTKTKVGETNTALNTLATDGIESVNKGLSPGQGLAFNLFTNQQIMDTVASNTTPGLEGAFDKLQKNGIGPANRGLDDMAAKLAALPSEKTIVVKVKYETYGATPP